MREGGMGWRAMRAADLDAVEAIASRLHPHHPERPEVFAERLQLAPRGCRVLAAQPGGALLGYSVSHPWRLALGPPALDSLIGTLPAAPDAWFVHDIALEPAARGAGQAAAVLAALLAAAAAMGIGRAMLVAIPGKEAYWARRGFRPVPPQDAHAASRLAGYGAGAVLMVAPAAAA
jgi:ribosomal protein S18 acetylase RimI-like enzyme